MPMSTRSRRCLIANEEPDQAESTGLEPLHLGLSTIENSALNSQNEARDAPVIGNVPISNSLGSSEPVTAPSLTLLQQHMEVSELRKLVEQLSNTQSSMMDFLQSMIEPHLGENLNSLHHCTFSIIPLYFL